MRGERLYSEAKSLHKKMYFSSNKLTQDDQKKLYALYFKLIKKAAYKGHLEALYDLGQQYEDIGYLGIINPHYNPKKCVYWYTKACQLGHAEAYNNLSSFYEKGEGCEKNLNYALALLKKSAELGSTLGRKNYSIMLKQMP
jgi:TPR repeat protein